MRDQADDLRMLSRPRDEFEVVQPDLSIRADQLRVTGRQLLEEGMLAAIDQVAIVAERQPEDLGGLQLSHVGSLNRPGGAVKTL